MFIASAAISTPQKDVAAYIVSKHALEALVKTIAFENNDTGVRANAIAPGMLATEANLSFMGDQKEKLVSPEQVAAKVSFLLSDTSQGINGTTLFLPDTL